MNHIWHKCEGQCCSPGNCPYCDGHVHHCRVCDGLEDFSLPTECPGEPMDDALQAVVPIYMDFIGCRWVGPVPNDHCPRCNRPITARTVPLNVDSTVKTHERYDGLALCRTCDRIESTREEK